MKHYLLPTLAAAAAIYATVSVVRTQPVRAATEPASPPPASAFSHTVAAVGLIEASTEHLSVGTPISGIVSEVTVALNQSVRAGTPLFRLDTRHLQASLAVQEAHLAAARARRVTARTQAEDLRDRLDRSRKLRGGTVISEEEWTRTEFALKAAEARVAEVEAEGTVAEASVAAVRTEIARCTIVAPIDATVLQLKIRPGEFATAGPTGTPLIVLGNLTPLHLRTDIDEHEAWRVGPESRARGHVRGNTALSSTLTFVRFEPFVIPKRSLTGDSLERVDTRVLQAVYRIDRSDLNLYVGQQMDVFIEATPKQTSSTQTAGAQDAQP
jgi:multidrug efflux pump subunit AcrA (membrane-fusion protein)